MFYFLCCLDMTLSTLPDVADCRNSRWCMAATETGNGNNLLNGISLRPDSNGYTHICDHAGLVCDTADIARR